jgi:hypothetical protein
MTEKHCTAVRKYGIPGILKRNGVVFAAFAINDEL